MTTHHKPKGRSEEALHWRVVSLCNKNSDLKHSAPNKMKSVLVQFPLFVLKTFGHLVAICTLLSTGLLCGPSSTTNPKGPVL